MSNAETTPTVKERGLSEDEIEEIVQESRERIRRMGADALAYEVQLAKRGGVPSPELTL